MLLEDLNFEKHVEVLSSLELGNYLNYDRQGILYDHQKLIQRQLNRDFILFENLTICCPENATHPYPFSRIDFIVRSLREINFGEHPSLLDVNSGTGAILLAMANYLGNGKYLGIENNPLAFKACNFNRDYNNISAKFIMGHLLAHLTDFDFKHIIFHPPFITETLEDDLEGYGFIEESHKLIAEFIEQVHYRFKPRTNIYFCISNLSDLSPLYDYRKKLTKIKTESFQSGMIRSLVKMVL